MTAALATAYHGPAELTGLRVLTAWTLDIPVLLVVIALGGGHLAGMRRARRAGQPCAVGGVAAFYGGGLGVLLLATMSFVGVYQGVLFYVRAAQTVLLLLVAPLFFALSRPLSLVSLAWPGAGRRVEAALRSRLAVTLTFPALTALVLVLTPFLLYFTPWFAAGLRVGAVRELTYLALLVPGFVFFWTLLRIDPVPRAYPYLVSLWVSGAEVIGDAVLGLAVLADPHLIAAAHYYALGRPWGPSPQADQVIGGGVLWILGDIVGLPFLAAQLVQMMREDEREAARIDADLDAALPAPGTTPASGATPGPAPAPAPGPAAAPSPDPAATAASRPWWESDPRFAHRFHPPRDG